MFNCWISKDGKIIEVPSMGHDNYAYNLLKTEMDSCDIENYIEENNCHYPYQILHKRGWVRVFESSNGKIRICGNGLDYTRIMRNTCQPMMNTTQIEVCKKLCKKYNTIYLDAINNK